MASGAKQKKGDETTPDFEASMNRLEAIVEEMEGGELSLEQMLKDFEEGQRLVAFCSRKLNEVEKKIEVLVKKGDKIVEEPLDAPEDE